jgi:hypothetical protein
LPKSFLWALSLGVVMTGSYLLGGSSLGAILTELMFIPIVILTIMVASHRVGRQTLVGVLILLVLVNLIFTVAPPASYTAIKIKSVVTESSYGAIYLGDVQKGSRNSGLFTYPSVSGALSLVGYQLSEALPLAGILSVALRLPCMFGCLVSLQRSVYLGLAASFVVSVLLSGTARTHWRTRILRLAAEVAVLVFALVIAWNLVPTPLTEAIQHRLSNEQLSSSSETRISSKWGWLTGLQAIMAAPILGSSGGRFAVGAEGQFIAPHNMLIFVGAKHGLPAMLVFALLLGQAFRGLLRYVRLGARGGERIGAVALCQSFVGAAIVFMFHPGYGPLYFWVVAGIGLAFPQRSLAVRPQVNPMALRVRGRPPGLSRVVSRTSSEPNG